MLEIVGRTYLLQMPPGRLVTNVAMSDTRPYTDRRGNYVSPARCEGGFELKGRSPHQTVVYSANSALASGKAQYNNGT